ncbi:MULTISPECIES: extracellular solute-binding protein [unclassified Clostridium]|uniref:ABC transporter substrate-binding protein n=1 Tax=unclassified Clostridium TaxID=2614128 RepID=UPI0002975978|nr:MULTISPECIES: extracellular solute-binding protein [unclassified Clostridium]EKQ58054.1 MAG: ABC-type Fe3+ transport system, periplasmic component [Clostridium sp. Maddingley MBC34-26]
MKKRFLSKRLMVLISVLIILSTAISGCSKNVSTVANKQETNASITKEPSVDELYEKAKQEGTVVVYSTSARANDAKKTFEAKYPGVKVEVSKLKSDEIMNKVISEEDAGTYNPDVIITKEVSGAVEEEMVKNGRYLRYLPEDIAAHVDEPFKTKSPGYANYLEFRTVFYNTDDFKEAPIKNWWDLTTPEWKGKIYAVDPLNSPAFMDLYTTMVINSDDMAAAYKEKFGKDVVLNGTENAGYEFIKELFANGLVVLKGSDDVLDAISKTGNKAVGISVSGDMSKIQEKGWHVSAIYDLKPKTSVPDPGYIYLAKNAPHENAGKLFMRWIMGEADGKAEGADQFNAVGSWVPRNDIQSKNNIKYEDLKLWDFDGDKLYKESPKLRDFWIKQSKN